jgi:hypothetical protein
MSAKNDAKFIKCENWWNVNSNLWRKSSVPTRSFKLRIKTYPFPLKEFKSDLLLMTVLIRFCLIESFNIKVGKGYVLMRNLKDLVGTEVFLHRLELTFHQFLHILCADNYLLKRQTITILIMNISWELFKKKLNRLTCTLK